MFFTPWLRGLKFPNRRPRSRRRRRATRDRRAPEICAAERLEDRTLLSHFFDIVEITSLPGSPDNTRAAQISLNNSGEITFAAGPSQQVQLYLFDGSSFTNINALPGAPPDGTDSVINDSGAIAFNCCNSPNVPGGFDGIFLFDGSIFTEITALPGSPGLGLVNRGVDMNNVGQIAWQHQAPFGRPNLDIFVFDSGTFTNISDLPGGPGSGRTPTINDSGQVLFRTNDGADDIFLYDSGTFTNITDLPGGPGSGIALPGSSLNNQGQVAFRGTTPGDHLFFYDGSTFIDIDVVDLPGPPSEFIHTFSLNDLGHLAMATGTDDGDGPGNIVFFDGSDFHTVATGVTNADVLLNNNGQIAFRAGPQVFLATPGGPVNNAPTAADNAVTTSEDTPYTFVAADFNFADVDAGDSLQSVSVVSLPAAGTGTLDLSGTAVIAGQVIAVGDINLGNLTFIPPADASGTPSPASPSRSATEP